MGGFKHEWLGLGFAAICPDQIIKHFTSSFLLLKPFHSKHTCAFWIMTLPALEKFFHIKQNYFSLAVLPSGPGPDSVKLPQTMTTSNAVLDH